MIGTTTLHLNGWRRCPWLVVAFLSLLDVWRRHPWLEVWVVAFLSLLDGWRRHPLLEVWIMGWWHCHEAIASRYKTNLNIIKSEIYEPWTHNLVHQIQSITHFKISYLIKLYCLYHDIDALRLFTRLSCIACNTCAQNGDHVSHHVMHPHIHPTHVSTYIKEREGMPKTSRNDIAFIHDLIINQHY